VTTADHSHDGVPAQRHASVDDLFRDVPVQSARDLACDGIFDTDDELDEFVAHVRDARHAGLA
jgi:hypothetical protein